MSDETPAERVSRFREHTNTNSSIRPPPDEVWKDLAMDALLDKFNDENDNTPAVRKASHPRRIMEPRQIISPRTSTATARKNSDAAATVATAEGTFGRFSRAFANVLGGVLGKRKAGHTDAEPVDPEQAALDERKRAAEEAYRLAKEQGLLPAPKVFVRPGMAPRAWSADTPTRARPPLTPRTPGSVARSASKRDLSKQKKLSKRVSSLEVKLASAKKELASVLANECFPVPPVPPHFAQPDPSASPAPDTPRVFSDDDAPLSPVGFADAASASLPGKITKKRKSVALADDDTYLPSTTPTALDTPTSTSTSPHRSLSKRLKRTSSRLGRKISRSSLRDARDEQPVVIRPGGSVPPVPVVPAGVAGQKVGVRDGDDGYGGLGHEIF